MAQNRTEKINEEVRRELSSIIRDLKDSRIPMMTSVVAVDVTRDLRYAKAYISVMGDKETQNNALAGLKSASGFVRREIGQKLGLRYTPEFLFELDNSIEQGAYINEVIKKVINKED